MPAQRALLALVFAMAGCGPRSAPPDAPAHKASPKTKKPPAKVVQVNTTGQGVDLQRVLVPGHVTIVDFWATWCGGCAVVEKKMMATIGGEPAIVVRKIDIGDGDTPVAKQHKVGALPHVRIYDRHGNLRYVLAGNDALTAGDAAMGLAKEK